MKVMKKGTFSHGVKQDGYLYITLLSLYELGDKIFGAIYIAFMRLRGLSIANISLLFSIQQLLLAILDLPTGAISDKIGRKRTASIGFVIFGVGIMLFCIGSNFWTFLPGMILFAMGIALISGAPGSWLIGQLLKKGEYEKRGEIISKAQTIIKFFSIIAALLSIVLINYSNELTIFAAGGLVVFAGVVGFIVGEDNYGETTDIRIHKIVKNSIKNLVKSKYLMFMAIKTVIGYISFIAFVLYWQIYATEYIGIKTKYLSSTLVLFMIALMLGNYVSSKLSKKHPPFIVVVIGYIISFIGYVLLIVNIHNTIILFLLGAFIIELGFGTEQISTFVWLNDYLDNTMRATYNSLFSTIECIFGFFIINILGIILDKFGIILLWTLSAVTIIFTIFMVIYLNKITFFKEGKV